VTGLPLSASTIYYYDIYASELAALSTPKKNYCDKALAVASEIEASQFNNDPNIANDIGVVRNICSFAPETPAASTPEAAVTKPAVLKTTPTATP
jgi:hypothetical protein